MIAPIAIDDLPAVGPQVGEQSPHQATVIRFAEYFLFLSHCQYRGSAGLIAETMHYSTVSQIDGSNPQEDGKALWVG